MRILILGADGMLGHKMVTVLERDYEVHVTLRDKFITESFWAYNNIKTSRLSEKVDVADISNLTAVIKMVEPKAIINCTGIIKQKAESKSAIPSIKINSLFPHQLADYCASYGIRLIHFSTDCVFSGIKGNYSEIDIPDPTDLYGRSKLLGELNYPGCLTLRTSIIGWELKNRASLLEWFASQRGKTIKGFNKAIYSGVSTSVLANLTGNLLSMFPDLSGIYHVSSNLITKYDLLVKLRDKLGWSDIAIEPDDSVIIDRSLNSACFNEVTGWQAPSWDEMINDLAQEWSLYEGWR
jgi:dTDP-4-dehydrorhamnose reductase